MSKRPRGWIDRPYIRGPVAPPIDEEEHLPPPELRFCPHIDEPGMGMWFQIWLVPDAEDRALWEWRFGGMATA